MVVAFRWIPRCVRPRSWSGTAVLSSSEVGDRRPQPRNRQGRTIHALEITGIAIGLIRNPSVCLKIWVKTMENFEIHRFIIRYPY
jgi:hypothetical protein